MNNKYINVSFLFYCLTCENCNKTRKAHKVKRHSFHVTTKHIYAIKQEKSLNYPEKSLFFTMFLLSIFSFSFFLFYFVFLQENQTNNRSPTRWLSIKDSLSFHFTRNK